MENYLLDRFLTPYETAPFEKIQLSDYLPAVKKAMDDSKQKIDTIANSNEATSFTNTIEELEFSTLHLDRVTAIFFNLNSAETSPEMQQLAQEISPLLTAFQNDIMLNVALFDKVKEVYDNKSLWPKDKEAVMLLKRTYNSFVRNGALLDEKGKNQIRKIDEELASLSLTFNENVLAETQDFTLHLENEDSLKGLPDSVIEAAQDEAKSRSLNGWVFTLDYPSYVPFMTYSAMRELRKKMALAFGARGFRGNKNDNTSIVKRIVDLRLQRAQLLGFDSHAHYVLDDRMAMSPEKVNDFLADLKQKSMPAAKKEFEQLSQFAAEKDGIQQLEKWDAAYYSEKLKQVSFDLDEEQLKPYFPLDKVIHGVFEIAFKLFGITFHETNTIQKYHKDVKTYEVKDENQELLAVFYADFHPRKGKRAGAWMTSFKSQYKKESLNSRPHVAIVCNFSKPTSSKPSLLTFNEVTTLFHEFGHALHGMMGNTKYPSLSGTSVMWDFVELPSQLMENWCYEHEALSIFAKHYETNEVLPQVYIEKITNSSNFLEGLATLRQLSFGMLDMTYHLRTEALSESLSEIEQEVMQPMNFYPYVKDNLMTTQFSHIFAGGYSSGYYSYKWAEVLDADAFEFFKEKGIFNSEVAQKFKTEILEKGGTQHPMELYISFRGKEPSNEALLKRAGLTL